MDSSNRQDSVSEQEWVIEFHRLDLLCIVQALSNS